MRPKIETIDLKFDHKAGSKANCPSEKCAEKSRRVAYIDQLHTAQALNIDGGFEWFATSTAKAGGSVTIFNPTDELLTSLMLVCMGELERRDEVRQRADGAL